MYETYKTAVFYFLEFIKTTPYMYEPPPPPIFEKKKSPPFRPKTGSFFFAIGFLLWIISFKFFKQCLLCQIFGIYSCQWTLFTDFKLLLSFLS